MAVTLLAVAALLALLAVAGPVLASGDHDHDHGDGIHQRIYDSTDCSGTAVVDQEEEGCYQTSAGSGEIECDGDSWTWKLFNTSDDCSGTPQYEFTGKSDECTEVNAGAPQSMLVECSGAAATVASVLVAAVAFLAAF